MNRCKRSFAKYQTVASIGALVVLNACAPTAFNLSYPDNNRAQIQAVQARISAQAESPINELASPIVFVVAENPTRLIAFDLRQQKAIWNVATEVSSSIEVGKQVVFYRVGQNRIAARQIRDGALAWEMPIVGGRLLGMTSDGDDLYYVAEEGDPGSTSVNSSLVAIAGSTGGTRWSMQSQARLGAPVARNGVVVLPLRYQSITVVDGSTGQEMARIRSKEEALLWVRSTPEGIFFGGNSGIYRLDEQAISGARAKSTFLAAQLPKSIAPVYWLNGYNAALVGYTAYNRNRLLWRVGKNGTSFLDDTLFAHHYRFFFAFDTTKGADEASLRWAYGHPRRDVVASSYTGKSLILISDDGKLVVLDKQNGTPVSTMDLGVAVRGATFDTMGFSSSGAGAAKEDLRKTLTEIIWDADRRFSAVKLFAVEQLARLEGGTVAQDLVKIVTQPGIDPQVYQRAGDVIVERQDKNSIPLYLRVLENRYNFVEGTSAQAVDIMARALGELKATEAVRPLLEHLVDHETNLSAMAEIVRALQNIGGDSIVEPFRDFLLTYRCDSEFGKYPDALNLIAETLVAKGSDEDRQMLSFVQNDGHTIAPLRDYLEKLMRQTDKKQKAEKEPAEKDR